MSRSALSKLARQAAQPTAFKIASRSSMLSRATTRVQLSATATSAITRNASTIEQRNFSSSIKSYKGLSPETEEPSPKEAEGASIPGPADITIEQYHELADKELENILAKLEAMQETREDVDVEYSAGVMNLALPPLGTYVLNKQPPNKQIWVSSPVSGPKRFDYVILGEGQHQKEGSGIGDWIYLRDGSSLSDLLVKEVGIDMTMPIED